MKETRDVISDMLRCCEKACEIEEKHYSSLLAFSSRLLSCISILSVALVSALTIDRDGAVFKLDPVLLLQMTGALLAGSFLLALIAQWRYRIRLAAPPLLDIEKDFLEMGIAARSESADYYVSSLSVYHESLVKRNRIIRILLDFSLLLLIAAVVSTVAWVTMHCV